MADPTPEQRVIRALSLLPLVVVLQHGVAPFPERDPATAAAEAAAAGRLLVVEVVAGREGAEAEAEADGPSTAGVLDLPDDDAAGSDAGELTALAEWLAVEAVTVRLVAPPDAALDELLPLEGVPRSLPLPALLVVRDGRLLHHRSGARRAGQVLGWLRDVAEGRLPFEKGSSSSLASPRAVSAEARRLLEARRDDEALEHMLWLWSLRDSGDVFAKGYGERQATVAARQRPGVVREVFELFYDETCDALARGSGDPATWRDWLILARAFGGEAEILTFVLRRRDATGRVPAMPREVAEACFDVLLTQQRWAEAGSLLDHVAEYVCNRVLVSAAAPERGDSGRAEQDRKALASAFRAVLSAGRRHEAAAVADVALAAFDDLAMRLALVRGALDSGRPDEGVVHWLSEARAQLAGHPCDDLATGTDCRHAGLVEDLERQLVASAAAGLPEQVPPRPLDRRLLHVGQHAAGPVTRDELRASLAERSAQAQHAAASTMLLSVVDEAGAPLEGAWISLWADRRAAGLVALSDRVPSPIAEPRLVLSTDAAGQVELPRPRMHEVVGAELDDGRCSALFSGAEVLACRDARGPLRLVVPHRVTLAGWVVAAHGGPAPWAEVSFRAGAGRRCGGSLRVPSPVTADADGRFTVEVSGASQEWMALALYDGHASEWVTVEPGIDALLRIAGEYAIEGRIVDEAGAPVPGCRVMARRRSGSAAAHTEVGPDGHFTLPLAEPGTYELVVTTPDEVFEDDHLQQHVEAGLLRGPERLFVANEAPRLTVGDGQPVARAEIGLLQAVSLTGRVVREDGRPLSGAVSARRADERSRGAGAGQVGRTVLRQDGSFRFARLPPDTRLDLTIEISGTTRMSFPVRDVAPGGPPLDIVIPQVAIDGLPLAGRVVDAHTGQPRVGFDVVLLQWLDPTPASGRGDVLDPQHTTGRSSTLRCEPGGRFAFEGQDIFLEYLVEVSAEGYATTRAGPFDLRESTDAGTIALPRLGTLAVRVVDEQGEGLGGHVLIVEPPEPLSLDGQDPSHRARIAHTGADGRLEIAAAPGRFVLQALAEGGRASSLEHVDVPMGERADVALVVGTPASEGTLSVEVVSAKGQLLAGASVELRSLVTAAGGELLRDAGRLASPERPVASAHACGHFTGLPHGLYMVYADDGEGGTTSCGVLVGSDPVTVTLRLP